MNAMNFNAETTTITTTSTTTTTTIFNAEMGSAEGVRDVLMTESEDSNHGGTQSQSRRRTTCKTTGCTKPNASRRTGGSKVRKQWRRPCEMEGCLSRAAVCSTRYCVTHGGGKRCQMPGCSKGANNAGKGLYCILHGGGTRCEWEGCMNSGINKGKFCCLHGGGKRCITEGCFTNVRQGSKHCAFHCGFVKCVMEGCVHGAAYYEYCKAHRHVHAARNRMRKQEQQKLKKAL